MEKKNKKRNTTQKKRYSFNSLKVIYVSHNRYVVLINLLVFIK